MRFTDKSINGIPYSTKGIRPAILAEIKANDDPINAGTFAFVIAIYIPM